MIFFRLQQLFIIVIVSYTLVVSTIWNKLYRCFRHRRHSLRTDKSSASDRCKISGTVLCCASEYTAMFSDKSNNFSRLIIHDGRDGLDELGEIGYSECSLSRRNGKAIMSTEVPDWIEGPRDHTTIHSIIDATRRVDPCEREYAFCEMIKVIERMDSSNDDNIHVFISVYDVIREWLEKKDEETLTRHSSLILEPMPYLIDTAKQHELLQKHVDPMIRYLVDRLAFPLITSNRSVFTVGVLLERHLIPEDAVRNQVIPTLFGLVEMGGDGMDDRRVEIAAVLCRVITCEVITDRRWLFDHFIGRFSHFLAHSLIHIRKAAVSIFGELPRLFGERFTELFVVPHLLYLCDDSNWGVRKAVGEVFVEVARHAPRASRSTLLAQRYIKLLHDPSRWVCYVAFQELGPFIATFADSDLTGLQIKDGQVCVHEQSNSNVEMKTDSTTDEFGRLPPGCWMPDDGEEEFEQDEGDEKMDSVLNGLQNMLASWNSGQKNSTIHSAPPSVIEDEEGPSMSIAAKCNSSDDLSKIGLDSTDNDRVYEDNDENMELDTTQVVEDEEHIVDEESLHIGMANKSDAKYQSISESFSQLSYWSTGYDAFSIDDEELMTFGSSDTILQATNFLERRFDVLYVSPENKLSQASPIISPRKSRNMTRSNRSEGSEEDTTFDEEKEEMKMDDTSDLFKDCRGIDEEDEIESRTEYRDIQKIVPQELVDNFMSMVLPGGVCDSDINRHCAHNFPAVAYTLGRANWPQLKDTYNRLASDDQWRVRVSIANSIHEMAAIVGSQSTDNDLLPVFNAFREDVPEVRAGVLKHLFEFYKCLTPSTRKAMIDILPQFMPMDNSMLHGNWRFRLEFARQCNKLCDIYGVEEINRTMSAIALTLANDRVAEVRKEAVLLLSQILARLVDHEWAETDLFVQDLVNGFAKTQKWTRRQTFAFVCERVLIDHSLSIEQFRYFLLSHLSAMACDNVANVRIAVCRALSLCDPSLYSPPLHFEITPPVGDVLSRLMDDDDMDVARSARVACGKQLTREIVDITVRGLRIREKEETLLETRMIDNYEEVDMSMSPNKSSSEA